MVEVVGVFSYFSCFFDYAGTVGMDVTSVLSKLVLCLVATESLATADCWFSSLVSLMCSEILVEM
jgi:hypothetical protein